jgi:4-aminobutyrate aminotransferase
VHAHYPNPFRNLFHESDPAALTERCLAYIRDVIFKTVMPPNEVAAFIIEPIQGEGGYIVPPDGFLVGLQQLAQAHGILLIADEVQCGIGRTGQFWASDGVAGFHPDIITSAKGIASGLPLGAVMARGSLMAWPPGAHASTFGGNPVSCAAAVATFDLIQGGLVQNAARQGPRLQDAFRAIQAKQPRLGDVRGRGLMVGLELVDPESGAPDPKLRDAVVDQAFAEGLLILGCGASSIRLCPPLVICEEQGRFAANVIENALA